MVKPCFDDDGVTAVWMHGSARHTDEHTGSTNRHSYTAVCHDCSPNRNIGSPNKYTCSSNRNTHSTYGYAGWVETDHLHLC